MKQALARLPASQRERITRQTALITLQLFGIHGGTAVVTRGGAAVDVGVPASQVCLGSERDASLIGKRVRQALPTVATVNVSVIGRGQSASAYYAQHCPKQVLPTVKGRTVITLRGSLITTSASFTVRAPRWTIEYQNSGTLIQISVLKNGQVQGRPQTILKRGVGKFTFTGPGRYQLRIAGAAGWTVRVQDGA